jgi:hypothetical protein
VTGRRAALVPPEMQELLELLAALSRRLPRPADGNWNRRDDLTLERQIELGIQLESLVLEMKYPSGRGGLVRYCQEHSRDIRAKLAVPLGYQPEPEPGPGGQRPGS